MATDTQAPAKGDIAAQQTYFARLFDERVDLKTLGPPQPLFHSPFTSAKGRLEYLEGLPKTFEGESLRHGADSLEQAQANYLARKRNDQKTYEDQTIAVKTALAWVTPVRQR